MRSSAFSRASALALISCMGCATAAAPSPPHGAARTPWESPLRAVHVDNLSADKVAQFEAARLEWLKASSEGGAPDRRGIFLQVGRTRFLTLRPISSFSDLDPKPRTKESPAVEAARAKYDRLSDAALVPPHANEIWEREEELDFPGNDPDLSERTAGASIMLVEQVHSRPEDGEADYVKAWVEVKDALASVRYPLHRVVYRARFGSGAVVSFWMAHSLEELKTTPTIEAALVSAMPARDAGHLLRRLGKCIASTERYEVVHRHDLSSPGF